MLNSVSHVRWDDIRLIIGWVVYNLYGEHVEYHICRLQDWTRILADNYRKYKYRYYIPCTLNSQPDPVWFLLLILIRRKEKRCRAPCTQRMRRNSSWPTWFPQINLSSSTASFTKKIILIYTSNLEISTYVFRV